MYEINEIVWLQCCIGKHHYYYSQERARTFTLKLLFVTIILDSALLGNHPEDMYWMKQSASTLKEDKNRST